ncbi:MAG: CZB domain-containing protein [Sulfurospirillaceae bacterium]|nr:CZB domain-containing protein [Sulfurospirillaceae bacterium]
MVFKTTAYSAILNEKADTIIADHKACRLGTWYQNSDTKERFGSTKSYIMLEEPHKVVHTCVLENAERVQNGYSMNNLHAFIDTFKTMEDSSAKLFKLLDSMISEVSAHK